jgi:hypothetical protein
LTAAGSIEEPEEPERAFKGGRRTQVRAPLRRRQILTAGELLNHPRW